MMCAAAPGSAFAQGVPAVAVSSGGPTLLWEKRFPTRIDKVAASADAKRLAVTLSPVCEDRPAPDDSYYLPREGTYRSPILRECKGGKLLYLDSKGRKLWEYPKAAKEGDIGVYNVVMSTDAKYLAASVIRKPCVLETRDMTISDNREYEDYPGQPLEEIRKAFKYMACRWDVVLLNSTGEELWNRPGKGFPKIAPDGGYVMVVPFVGRDIREEMFEYGNSWLLINREGKILFEKKVSTDTDVKAVLTLTEDKFSDGPISEYGRRLILDNAVYDVSGDTITKLSLTLPENIYLNHLSTDGSLVRAVTPQKWGSDAGGGGYFYLINIATDKVVREGENIFAGGALSMRELFSNELFPDFEIWGKSLSYKYSIERTYKRFPGRYIASLRDMMLGKELSVWEIPDGPRKTFILNKEKNIMLEGYSYLAFHSLPNGRLLWRMNFKDDPLRHIYPLSDGHLVGISVDNALSIYSNSEFLK